MSEDMLIQSQQVTLTGTEEQIRIAMICLHFVAHDFGVTVTPFDVQGSGDEEETSITGDGVVAEEACSKTKSTRGKQRRQPRRSIWQEQMEVFAAKLSA